MPGAHAKGMKVIGGGGSAGILVGWVTERYKINYLPVQCDLAFLFLQLVWLHQFGYTSI